MTPNNIANITNAGFQLSILKAFSQPLKNRTGSTSTFTMPIAGTIGPVDPIGRAQNVAQIAKGRTATTIIADMKYLFSIGFMS